MPFGAIHDELRVAVPRVGGRQSGRRRVDVLRGVHGVDMASDHVREHDRKGHHDVTWLVDPVPDADQRFGQLGREHDPAPGCLGVDMQHPQRRASSLHHRDVLEFLKITARVPLPQRGRYRESGYRCGPDLPSHQRRPQRRQRGWQVDAHEVPKRLTANAIAHPRTPDRPKRGVLPSLPALSVR